MNPKNMTRVAWSLLGAAALFTGALYAQQTGVPSFYQGSRIRLGAPISGIPQPTANRQHINGTAPTINLNVSDAAADSRAWVFQATNAGGLILVPCPDSLSGCSGGIKMKRSGTVSFDGAGGIQSTGACGTGTYVLAIGVELCVGAAGTEPWIQGYDRNTANYKNVNINALSLSFSASGGPEVSLTPSSNNFVVSFDDACTTTPTVTFSYQVVGNLVTIWPRASSGFPCTSDSTAFRTTATPVPAAIRPATSIVAPVGRLFSNNGATVNGCVSVLSTGGFQYEMGSPCSSGGFTAASTKDGWLTNAPISYGLGTP